MMRAHRHRFAHLSSASRMPAIIFWRSSSVFSGIQAGASSDMFRGSRRGEQRMKAPKSQNGGNTERKDADQFLKDEAEKKERTKSESEEIHGERHWLGCMQCVFRKRDASLFSVWW